MNRGKYHVYNKSTFGQQMTNCQDPCACTRFWCMRNTLVHAQRSCACTGPGNPMARDQARGQGPGLGPKKAAVQCNNLVHAPES